MKLTNVEKMAIEGMLNREMSVSEIKSELGKSPKSRVVENYISTLSPQNPNPPVQPAKQQYDHKAVLKKMHEAGIHGADAERLIQRALLELGENPSVTQVYNEAVAKIGPREFMIRESANGVSKGVTILTEQAARFGDRGDREARGISEPKVSRSTKNSVYNPKTGETY